MQDIRKPYTRSRSNHDLQSRVEQFERARYHHEDSLDDEEPVRIPLRPVRRDVRSMDMYPRRKQEEEYIEEEYYDDSRDHSFSSKSPSRTRVQKKRSLMSTFAFIGGVFALVTFVGLYTYVFDSATITIVPKYKDVPNLGQTFVFSQDTKKEGAIPYVVSDISLSKSKVLSLSESRKVEAKASGRAVIYNNYDSNPQKLIKNTRFESSKGKIYRITQSVEVPGKSGSTPGSVEVTLYADSTGAEYNIDSTTFSIPGFKGTARESAFYAKTKGAISGGSSGTLSLASISDLNAAKDSLAVALKREVEEEAKKKTKEGFVPLYSAMEVTFEDNETELLQGKTSTYKVTATGHLMFAEEQRLANAIAKTLGDYDGAPVTLLATDALTYTRKETDRVTGSSSLSLLIEGSPRVVWVSDKDAIREMVQGKKRDEFKPLMKTINSIESAEISFSPLWLSRFPSSLSKLSVVESVPKR